LYFSCFFDILPLQNECLNANQAINLLSQLDKENTICYFDNTNRPFSDFQKLLNYNELAAKHKQIPKYSFEPIEEYFHHLVLIQGINSELT